MNVCRDCKFYRYSRWGDSCHHPSLLSAPDPIHGGRVPFDPRVARSESGPCGTDGALFVPREDERFGWRGWVGAACFVGLVVYCGMAIGGYL